VCGINKQESRYWRISVQYAYIDESESTTRLIMAGFVSTVEKWARFSNAWQAELDRPPAIPFLHMNEVLSPKGVFEGTSFHERFAKVDRLIDIANTHVGDNSDEEFSVSMNLADYNEILKPVLNFHRKTRSHFKTLYNGLELG
jgi:hypothetical protein